MNFANLKWNVLGNSPSASSRTDDIWFFNQNEGFLVNSSGYVAMTEDGGDFWHQKFFLYPGETCRPYLRCMGWGSRDVGWFGAVCGFTGAGSNYRDFLLHHTTDGGNSWAPVTNLPVNAPAGICGFYAVNEQVAYGSGVNDPSQKPGPSVIKTTDGGKSWDLIPMNEYCDNLIDIYFMDELNGFVVGGKIDPNAPTNVPAYNTPRLQAYVQLKPVVLRTFDGGLTWTNTTANITDFIAGEWGWKIQFISDKVGFVSLENFRDASILKTTDGGQSWTHLHVSADQTGSLAINNDLEGIGFIDENHGWVGGWGIDFIGQQNSYTADGGQSWIRQDNNPSLSNLDASNDPRLRINRYRFIKDKKGNLLAGYCSGQQVYKLNISTSGGGGGGSKKSAFANNSASGKKAAFASNSSKSSAFASTQPGCSQPTHGGMSFEKVDDEDKKLQLSQPDGQQTLSPSALKVFEKELDLACLTRDDGSVEISYNLTKDAKNVFVGLWNQFAFHIKTLVGGQQQTKGRQSLVWDGKNTDGEFSGDGVYICRMSIDDGNASHMVTLETSS
ncbi:MAG: photosystem II stability/assembly factor-like uncharacterized protein [Phenylobacterium sp.]|jgi:photosystem II stability/assembly factor-like uncharacterized protein